MILIYSYVIKTQLLTQILIKSSFLFPLGLMQINSLSTLKSLPSLLLFVILSTAQTYHPISTNILINNSPIVRVQKAYFLETPHFGSTSQYNMNRKTIRFILAVSAEHRRYNNTLYNIFYYIQTCGGKTRTELSDSLH